MLCTSVKGGSHKRSQSLFIYEGDGVDTILLRQASIKYFVLDTSFNNNPKESSFETCYQMCEAQMFCVYVRQVVWLTQGVSHWRTARTVELIRIPASLCQDDVSLQIQL
jgi:hypothetical protein